MTMENIVQVEYIKNIFPSGISSQRFRYASTCSQTHSHANHSLWILKSSPFNDEKSIPHSINLHIKCLSNARCYSRLVFFHLGKVCLTVFISLPHSNISSFIERGKILIHFLRSLACLLKSMLLKRNEFISELEVLLFVCEAVRHLAWVFDEQMKESKWKGCRWHLC